jgi:F420-0:gamma-glutamyl ligase
VKVIPLKTAVLVPGDDIVEVARAALDSTDLHPTPSDILVICESPLAITQGRIIDISDVHPGIAARVLCRLFDFDSSLCNPYAFQVAVDLAGLPRILLALTVAIPGRVLRRRGDFYRIAGRQVAWIDDIPGNLPPYTQDIVLGPDDPTSVARRVAASLGCGAAVVDANDLGRVEICGASPFIDHDMLVEAMRPNPQGNADEQTPLVLVQAS